MALVHAHIRSCEPIHTVVSANIYRDIGRKVRSHVLFSSKEMLLFFGENAHFLRRKPTFCPNKIVILSFLGVKRLFSFPFLSKHELPEKSIFKTKERDLDIQATICYSRKSTR